MFLERNYDVICRDGNLGTLLAAFFLMKSGKKVLLLPSLSSPGRPHPPYLLPLVAGFPRQLLEEADLLAGKVVDRQSHWFHWTDGQHVFNCPATISGRMSALSLFMGDHFPWFESHFTDLKNIWHTIDAMMSDGLMIPAAGLKDHGKILKVLIKHQEILQNRREEAKHFYSDASIPPWLSDFFISMIPQMSLFRYRNLPMVSFAYGMATMFQDSVMLNLDNLLCHVREVLLENGCELSPADFQVIFDGKWYVGVGSQGKIEMRSRAYITDSAEETLKREIPKMDQRRDFFRQFTCQQKGFTIHRFHGRIAGNEKLPETGRWFYAADHVFQAVQLRENPVSGGLDLDICCPAEAADLDPNLLLSNIVAGQQVADFLHHVSIDFQPQPIRETWGYQPKLPPVMGGAFLPVISFYKKFYHVGWENLPGFGLGGLVYAARKTADRIIDKEI